MALHEDARFGRTVQNVPHSLLEAVLFEHHKTLNAAAWVHCGYAPLRGVLGVHAPKVDVNASVNNQFRLGPSLGFERVPVVVTTGLRTSRFASILFWEVLHAMTPSGVWIDIDDAARCTGTALGPEDYPQRDYFRSCLRLESRQKRGAFFVQTYRKIKRTPLAADIDDKRWTFGILTSGTSDQGARMAAAILALDLPKVEVIFCGPQPDGVPKDDRVRAIDVERLDSGGWTAHKKTLIANAARYGNLCLLHDRYVITPEWAEALKAYGPCYAFLTFPQVYHAGVAQLFPQRYPDYQLLDQRRGLADAFAARVYDADRVFHPEYDDFAETAFCCGGLYIARRSLWNLLRQDEALYYSDWEDISFGLDCQRRGLPHRINPIITVASTTAHPLLLTRLHTIRPTGQTERGRLHVTQAQEEAARTAPELFKPVVPIGRGEYYEKIRQRFNAIDGLGEWDRLPANIAAGCTALADFWARIERHVSGMTLTTREQISQVAYFLSDTVHKWPAPQVQFWIRRHELGLAEPTALARFSTVVGWGTGSAFRSSHQLIGRDLAFVVDSNPSKWGTAVDGVAVHPPASIGKLDATSSAVVVFSCFFEEIAARIRTENQTIAALPAGVVMTQQRFQPLVDLIEYFREIELYYPVLFDASAAEALSRESIPHIA